MAAQTWDLDAVVGEIGGAVALFAEFHAAAIASAYAGIYPDKVPQPVLWCGYALRGEPKFVRALGMCKRGLGDYSETAAHRMLGWSSGRDAR